MIRLIVLLSLLLPTFVHAQIGGRNVFDFLNLAPAARVASLGSVNISTYDHDANFAFQNPALLNDSMHQQVSFNIVNYLADITYGYTSYSRSFEGIGDFHTGLQFVNYGKMIQADEYGNQLGTFSASDLAWVIGGSRKVNNFRIGLNMKLINSNISGFQSHWAMAFDLGGLYVSKNKLFTAGMVFQNMGFNFNRYNLTDGTQAPLPFEVQIGISQRLAHMPLRFSVTLIHLETPDLIYSDPDPEPQFDLSGELIEPKKQIADHIFRHFVFGGEFLLSKSFNLRAGYNHMRRQELRSLNKAGFSGFSFGAGIKISHFRLDYGLTSYHAIGASHNFSIATNIGSWQQGREKRRSAAE